MLLSVCVIVLELCQAYLLLIPLDNFIVQRNGNAVSPLSRYLVISSASGSSSTNRKVPKACLLTIDQCLAELEEKECNMKLAAEEKERKKKEREEK